MKDWQKAQQAMNADAGIVEYLIKITSEEAVAANEVLAKDGLQVTIDSHKFGIVTRR